MEQQPFIPFRELHSEEVHEIISRPPHWLLRRGITLIFVLMSFAAAAAWWIRYPDIVPASFTLTSGDAPRKVLARSTGRIQKLLVSDGETVSAGQVLLYSESTASHDQVLKLDGELEGLYQVLSEGNWDRVHRFSPLGYTGLGELQSGFQTFYQQFDQLKTVLAGGYLIKKRQLLLEDVTDLKAMEAMLIEQRDLQQRDFQLANQEFKVQERLFKEEIIPVLEYNREKAKLLARELPLKNLSSSLIQNRTLQTGKQKELLELDNAVAQQKSGALQALQTLRSGIETWKQSYVLYAPVAGRLSFAEPWQEQQNVTTGQEMITVEPDGLKFRGLVRVSQGNLGKIAEGQIVLVKLEGYPYREYGMLEGKLTQLSPTPGKDSVYWGYVDLPKGLSTRYGKELDYKNGMKGTADIITRDRRLAERLFATVRDGGK